ncbi:MAG: hypothetical protein Q8K97_04600 [Pseudohongiella sp.]|nr:hypothetical protein [Pseudohongiella sp.]
MSMAGKINVNTHYTRSVNLERDKNSIDVVNAYIPTSRAVRTLARVADSFHEQLAPRAWSLIGPYGSGKSSFSVFMSQLLSSPGDDLHTAAINVLKKSESGLAKQFIRATKNSDGYFKILLTGAPEPLGRRLAKALSEAAERFWDGRRGKKPAILAELRSLAEQQSLSTTEILAAIKQLQEQLAKNQVAGMLIVIDELGKFLEYEARHYGVNDIYLLQELAEHACKGGPVNLLLFVMLHQSFEQYAKGLGENLKNEWSKVQGRFEEVPFLESTEQVLRVVSSAFDQVLTKQERAQVTANSIELATVLEKNEALPGALSATEAAELFASCYPIHPVTAILLPMLCQKIAQNERTLFSYLGSHEDYGFQDLLSRMTSVNDYIYPHDVYDYFITNQSAALGDYMTSRRWAEVVTAIERLGDAKIEEINLLKTIGILNIIGSKGGFKASKSMLELCIEGGVSFNKLFKALNDKAVVNFRRFNNEYRVWQGSDFDLEEALQEELSNLGNFSLADELNSSGALLPIVARRYTIENGALRYFAPIFVDAQTYKNAPSKSDQARIVFFLATGQDDQKIFRDIVVGYFSDLDLVVLCLGGAQLREAVAETQALKRIRSSRQELNSDPVAKREFEDRLTAAENAEDRLLNELTDQPEQSDWFYKSKQQSVANRRGLQEVLSFVLKSVYDKAPTIHNELINRDKPSSQAAAARNKLLSAMLTEFAAKDLGIEKFPPEKAIYRSVLLATGIHKEALEGEMRWVFSEPSSDASSDIANIAPVWDRISGFLDSTEKKARSFAELNPELMAPPYGMKAGLLPIMYMAVYMTYKHELAFYENGRYLPYFDDDKLDRFVKRPDEFTVQRFRIEGLKASIYEQYQKALFKDNKQRTVVELISPLANFMSSLPKFTKQTKSQDFLDLAAIAVRDAFETASSPERLLFALLPKALGFSESEANESEAFSEALREAIRKLKYAHENLLDKLRLQICDAFDLSKELSVNDLRAHFRWYSSLAEFTIERDGLKAFIKRLALTQGNDADWFESIVSFLGQLPSKEWTDSVCREAEYKLRDFSIRLLDLEKLYLAYRDHKGERHTDDIDVYVLKSFKLRGDMNEQVVVVDKRQRERISEIKKQLKEAMDREFSGNQVHIKAVLAELVNEYLSSSNIQKVEKKLKLKTAGGNNGNEP